MGETDYQFITLKDNFKHFKLTVITKQRLRFRMEETSCHETALNPLLMC